eukprot:2469774-Prymnesium_polylepis.1
MLISASGTAQTCHATVKAAALRAVQSVRDGKCCVRQRFRSCESGSLADGRWWRPGAVSGDTLPC